MTEAAGSSPAADATGGSGSVRSLPSDSGNQYQQLSAAINAQVELLYHTSVTLVQFPSQGNFLWYYQNVNQVFNNGTFGYLSARVGPGDAAGLVKLTGPGGYPNAYAQLLSQIEYCLSAADRAAGDPDVLQRASYGNTVLAELRATTTTPTAANGGMLTVDPSTGEVSTGYQVGYAVNLALATIQNGLQSNQPTLTVQVPASQTTTATISYPGCQLVPLQPSAWQQATDTGWFDLDPIEQAYANGQNDVTGYRFIGTPPYQAGSPSAGGNFARLVSLLISNQPVVQFGAASTNQATEFIVEPSTTAAFSVNPATVAEFYQTYDLLALEQPDDTELFVLPEANGATVPQLQQSAYVVGACLDYVQAAH